MIKRCPYCDKEFETNKKNKIYCQGYCAYHAGKFREKYQMNGVIHQLVEPETVDWKKVEKEKEYRRSKNESKK